MANLTAKQILTREYGDSKNFMTPTIESIGKISSNIAYEISSGLGMSNQKIYGLSIVEYDPETNTTKRGIGPAGCFQSLRAAQQAIDDFAEELD